MNFRLIDDARRKFRCALKGNIKSSSTKDFLRIDSDTYKTWKSSNDSSYEMVE